MQDNEPDGVGAGDLTQSGLAVYEAKPKALLEPKDDGKFVAIYVDTEDYEVAPSSGQATRALLRRHPIDGRIVVRKIGPEPEYGLLARDSPVPRIEVRGEWLPARGQEKETFFTYAVD